jgi:hypothetical protein
MATHKVKRSKPKSGKPKKGAKCSLKTKLSRSSVQFLRKLRKAKIQARKALIRKASPKELQLITESCLGVRDHLFPVTPKRQAALKKYKRALEVITSRQTPCKRRKQVLSRQSGGLLTAVLASAVPVLATLVKDQFFSK